MWAKMSSMRGLLIWLAVGTHSAFHATDGGANLSEGGVHRLGKTLAKWLTYIASHTGFTSEAGDIPNTDIARCAGIWTRLGVQTQTRIGKFPSMWV